MNGYECKIVDCSEDLSLKDRIKLKTFSNSGSPLEENMCLKVKAYAECQVHNENAKPDQGGKINVDYTVYAYLLDNDEIVYTSSSSFHQAFLDICSEIDLSGEKISDQEFIVRSKKSNNNQGSFYVASLL